MTAGLTFLPSVFKQAFGGTDVSLVASYLGKNSADWDMGIEVFCTGRAPAHPLPWETQYLPLLTARLSASLWTTQ